MDITAKKHRLIIDTHERSRGVQLRSTCVILCIYIDNTLLLEPEQPINGDKTLPFSDS